MEISKTKYKIGDTLKIDNKDLKNKEYKIVGTIVSPLYFNQTNLSQTRGTSSLGTGVVNFYSYVLESSFDVDYYTNIYLTVNDANNKITSKKEYLTLIDNITKEIENIKKTQEQNRYDKIYNEALEEITTEETKINNELKDA